jgi:hypothetical protein
MNSRKTASTLRRQAGEKKRRMGEKGSGLLVRKKKARRLAGLFRWALSD